MLTALLAPTAYLPALADATSRQVEPGVCSCAPAIALLLLATLSACVALATGTYVTRRLVTARHFCGELTGAQLLMHH